MFKCVFYDIAPDMCTYDTYEKENRVVVLDVFVFFFSISSGKRIGIAM